MADAVNDAGRVKAAGTEVERELVVGWTEALKEERDWLQLEGAPPIALCLSGGGIRSATFCLGVLQELARQGLLHKFHYLSTVSGGGYIGAWLTRVIGSQLDAKSNSSDPVAMDKLAALISRTAAGAEPDALRNLRRYTNFLTPNPGLASLDTWAGAVLWLRNTLVNWLVFIPVFAAIVAVPILYFALAAALLNPDMPPAFDYLLGGLAVVCLVLACTRTILLLPSHSHPDRHPDKPDKYGPNARTLLLSVILPILVWCYAAPIAVTAAFRDVDHDRAARTVFTPAPAGKPQATGGANGARTDVGRNASPLDLRFTALPLASGLGALLAYGLALWRISRKYPGEPLRKSHLLPFKDSWPAWVVSCAVSAVLTWYGIWLARGLSLFWITLAGPAWVGLAEVLRSTLYVAFRRGGLRAELDREWLARLNALKLSLILPAAVIGTAAIAGGLLTTRLTNWGLSLAAAGGLTAGSVAAFLGRSAWTAVTTRDPNPPRRLPVQALIAVGIVLFALTLLILFGRAVAVAAGGLAALATEAATPSLGAIALAAAVILVTAAGLAYGLGLWINLNRFSMHAVYRNRLVRAFLGSARPEKDSRPDRFTQFDPADNLRMADAIDRRSARVLFPVVNVALNRTSGKDTARAERKAESFTITPLRCGAASLGGLKTTPDGKTEWKGAYVATDKYAGNERQTGTDDKARGISLGTAITISGAAASPNMGYHSSPLIAFVMTLFNVRLGAWLPNPGAPNPTPEKLEKAGPSNGLGTLLAELGGQSDRDSDHLYLSDGGHFDNLGLYEMLRRRCRLILVIDASQDADYGYEDLGRTVQHALVDLGVAITFDPVVATRECRLRPSGALGTIRYPEGGEGRLLYLKPWMATELGVEITSYQVRKNSFPHVSTGNQFFTESDFEAYRHLGEAIMRAAITGASKGAKPLIERLFTAPVATEGSTD